MVGVNDRSAVKVWQGGPAFRMSEVAITRPEDRGRTETRVPGVAALGPVEPGSPLVECGNRRCRGGDDQSNVLSSHSFTCLSGLRVGRPYSAPFWRSK